MIRAEGLTRRFGDHLALDDVDLRVPAGAVCGLLGPNGAGKSTVVRTLATLLRIERGHAEVAGADVAREPALVRERSALTGQFLTVDEFLDGRECLMLWGRLAGLSRRAARLRADELLERFELTGAARRAVRTWSGGMKRRLDLASSLVRSPRVLFLDEPTTGLDPRSRSELWAVIRDLVSDGTTVLLTTQYLEEADRLADRITVLDRGRVVAEGTPAELKSDVGRSRLEVVVADAADVPGAADVLERQVGTRPDVDRALRQLGVPVDDRLRSLERVAGALRARGLEIEHIGLRRPTLDEVFLQVTGGPA